MWWLNGPSVISLTGMFACVSSNSSLIGSGRSPGATIGRPERMKSVPGRDFIHWVSV